MFIFIFEKTKWKLKRKNCQQNKYYLLLNKNSQFSLKYKYNILKNILRKNFNIKASFNIEKMN